MRLHLVTCLFLVSQAGMIISSDVSLTSSSRDVITWRVHLTHLPDFLHDDCRDPEVKNKFHGTKSSESLGRVKAREVHCDDVSVEQDEHYVRHLEVYREIQ